MHVSDEQGEKSKGRPKEIQKDCTVQNTWMFDEGDCGDNCGDNGHDHDDDDDNKGLVWRRRYLCACVKG